MSLLILVLSIWLLLNQHIIKVEASVDSNLKPNFVHGHSQRRIHLLRINWSFRAFLTSVSFIVVRYF